MIKTLVELALVRHQWINKVLEEEPHIVWNLWLVVDEFSEASKGFINASLSGIIKSLQNRLVQNLLELGVGGLHLLISRNTLENSPDCWHKTISWEWSLIVNFEIITLTLVVHFHQSDKALTQTLAKLNCVWRNFVTEGIHNCPQAID